MKEMYFVCGDTAQQLRECIDLAKAQVGSQHPYQAVHNCLYNPSSRGSDPLFWSLPAAPTHVQIPTYRHINKKISIFNRQQEEDENKEEEEEINGDSCFSPKTKFYLLIEFLSKTNFYHRNGLLQCEFTAIGVSVSSLHIHLPMSLLLPLLGAISNNVASSHD